jgi:cytochrome c biogenesis protein CcdA
VAVSTSPLRMDLPVAQTSTWRSRTLIVILIVTIAAVFWVDSRYPALMKRYYAGTQLKATGALTFGTVYRVDPSMSYPDRVWRTTVNWLDAKGVGMTFSFLFGPAALTFLATLRRRRTQSRYPIHY